MEARIRRFIGSRSNTVLLLAISLLATAGQDALFIAIGFPNPGVLDYSIALYSILGLLASAYWAVAKPDYSPSSRPLGITLLAIQTGIVGLVLLFEGLVLLLLPVIGLAGVVIGGLGICFLWIAKKQLEGMEIGRTIALLQSLLGIIASPIAILYGLSAPVLALFQFWYLRRPYVKDFFYGELQPEITAKLGQERSRPSKGARLLPPQLVVPPELLEDARGALLSIEGLRTYFYTYAGVVKAVDGVSLHVGQGETVGIVGESGSGKTVTALSIMRIVPPPGQIVQGRIVFQNRNILEETEEVMQRLRGKEIGYIFQDPTSTLDPVYTVGQQLSEVLMRHQNLDKTTAFSRAVELLRLVEIPDPEVRINQYPHELSGGTKQRIAIARALSCNPSLLLADEPTTALDVTIQAQILELMKGLKNRFNMAMVLISHDLGIVAETCDRIVILYAGQVYESGTTQQVLENPKHPYTEALLNSVPHLALRKGRLSVIPGNIPNLIDPPSGCRFHPRCKYAQQICIDKVPELELMEEHHFAACHRAKELKLISPVAS